MKMYKAPMVSNVLCNILMIGCSGGLPGGGATGTGRVPRDGRLGTSGTKKAKMKSRKIPTNLI